MEEIDVVEVAEAEVENAVLVEGLPGVGHVGKLVAEHVVEELDSTLLRRIYSHHFPPQCTVDDDGIAHLVNAELYHCSSESDHDLLVLTGDHQSQTIEGHYGIASEVLDMVDEFDVETVYTLGGIATGELVEDYGVVGAANDPELVDDLEEFGVEFGDGEPEGGIIGVSGLLVGIGERRGVSAVCLMGETSGYMVDPKSAQVVLDVLMERLGFEVSTQRLEERAEEMEEVVQQLEEMNRGAEMPKFSSEDDLRYIG